MSQAGLCQLRLKTRMLAAMYNAIIAPPGEGDRETSWDLLFHSVSP